MWHCYAIIAPCCVVVAVVLSCFSHFHVVVHLHFGIGVGPSVCTQQLIVVSGICMYVP